MAQWLILTFPALEPAVRLFAQIAHDFVAEFPAYLLTQLEGMS